jgi:CheY-like chemotaxis protein
MPELNGCGLIGAIREKFGNKMKIVVVNGWANEEKVKNEHGINFVLQKPFTSKTLKKILTAI